MIVVWQDRGIVVNVPDFGQSVFRASDQAFSIRTPGDEIHAPIMSLERPLQLPGRRIPERDAIAFNRRG
jgi:hypothetical protein